MLRHIQVASTVTLGLVLTAAALGKWLNFRWFVGVLAKYGLVPRGSLKPVAFAIASLETILGPTLLLRVGLPWSADCASGLFLVFGTVIALSLARGKIDIDCGCTGLWKKAKVRWPLVSRNLGLAGLAFLSGRGGAWAGERVHPWIFAGSALLTVAAFFPRQCRGPRDRSAGIPGRPGSNGGQEPADSPA